MNSSPVSISSISSEAPFKPSTEKAILLLLTLIQVVHSLDFVILMPLGPVLMRSFAIEPREFTWMVSAYAIAASIVGLLSAFIIDRFDRKKSLLFLFAGFTLGTFLCAISPDHRFFIFSRIVTGGFGGVLAANTLAIVGDIIPFERRGAATGQVLSAFSISSVIGIPLGLAAANHWNWHAPFLLLVGLSIALWGVSWKLLPPLRRHLHPDLAPAHRSFKEQIAETFFSRGVPFTLFFALVIVFSAFLVIPMISPSMVSNGGIREVDLPWVYFAGGFVTFFTSRKIGKLADLYGKKKVFRVMATLSIFPMLMITHMPPLPLWTVVAITTLFMFTMNGRYVPAMALFTNVVPPERRGNFMNLIASVQQFAVSLGALASGWIVSRNPATQRIEGYPTVGWIALGTLIFCILTAQWIGEHRSQEKSP